jgi:peptidoglycan/LPS O-acetylase OafA/YrhL
MRNKRLDVLRCIAVLLVLVHHGEILSFFTRVGWTGVDLFFVLSGFLISGLLFSEYRKRHSIGFKRFFIRRGLKIYPAFYAFLFLTGVVSYGVFHALATPAHYLHEIFFVQNYEKGVWDHTWSLAIEEHFYIFLPVLLLVLVRFSSNRQDPFRILPWAFVAIATMCIAFRAESVYWGTPNFFMPYVATHERMDSLFFGVLLGYLYHFRPQVLERLMRPTGSRVGMAAVSAVLLSTAYFFSRDEKLFATFGYSCLYLGYGGVLLLSLYVQGVLPGGVARITERIGTGFAWVGMYSYSIYLWHGPTGAWFPGLVRRALHISMGRYERFTIYLFGSLAIGILMSRLIEYPVLRLRDRLIPARQIVAVATHVEVAPAPPVATDAAPSA